MKLWTFTDEQLLEKSLALRAEERMKSMYDWRPILRVKDSQELQNLQSIRTETLRRYLAGTLSFSVDQLKYVFGVTKSSWKINLSPLNMAQTRLAIYTYDTDFVKVTYFALRDDRGTITFFAVLTSRENGRGARGVIQASLEKWRSEKGAWKYGSAFVLAQSNDQWKSITVNSTKTKVSTTAPAVYRWNLGTDDDAPVPPPPPPPVVSETQPPQTEADEESMDYEISSSGEEEKDEEEAASPQPVVKQEPDDGEIPEAVYDDDFSLFLPPPPEEPLVRIDLVGGGGDAMEQSESGEDEEVDIEGDGPPLPLAPIPTSGTKKRRAAEPAPGDEQVPPMTVLESARLLPLLQKMAARGNAVARNLLGVLVAERGGGVITYNPETNDIEGNAFSLSLDRTPVGWREFSNMMKAIRELMIATNSDQFPLVKEFFRAFMESRTRSSEIDPYIWDTRLQMAQSDSTDILAYIRDIRVTPKQLRVKQCIQCQAQPATITSRIDPSAGGYCSVECYMEHQLVI